MAWCILFAATGAWAGPYENGVKAYNEGKFETALTLWLPLAEQGLVAAQMSLGVLYEKGEGVSQDFAEAARWYMKAAERGHAEAQLDVAMLYEQGIGLPLDPDAGIRAKRAIDVGIATRLEAEGMDVFGPEASRRWTK